MMIDAEEMARLRGLLAKAFNPTEWTTWPEERHYIGLDRVGWFDEGEFHEICWFVAGKNDTAHAKLVAEGVKSLSALLDAADRALALEAENARLREVLDWYRVQTEGCRKLGSIGEPFRNALDADGGKRASVALKGELK